MFTYLVVLQAAFLLNPAHGYLSQNNDVYKKSGTANSGLTADVNSKNLGTLPSSLQLSAVSNKAYADKGAANSGTDLLTDGTLKTSIFGSVNTADGNVAASKRNSANAGTQSVFNNIDGAVIVQGNRATDNIAYVGGAKAKTKNPDANAGVSTEIKSVKGESQFLQSNTAIGNTAGNSLSGGDTVSGVKTTVNTVSDSTVSLVNKAKDNYAVGEDVTAGDESIFGKVSNSQIDISSKSTNNRAVQQGKYGSSISGVGITLNSATNTDVNIETVAKNNFASAEKGTAISGTVVGFGTLNTAPVTVDAVSKNNKAYSDRYYDAIAGVRVFGNKVEDSTVVVVADSQNNRAVADGGDAIAGNQVNIKKTDKDSTVVVDLSARKNKAYSVSGDAIIDQDVNIGGNALTLGN